MNEPRGSAESAVFLRPKSQLGLSQELHISSFVFVYIYIYIYIYICVCLCTGMCIFKLFIHFKVCIAQIGTLVPVYT